VAAGAVPAAGGADDPAQAASSGRSNTARAQSLTRVNRRCPSESCFMIPSFLRGILAGDRQEISNSHFGFALDRQR
jgi:hypothetical protein